jgi:membrane-associated protease RseP (regulator of RpoE activity)
MTGFDRFPKKNLQPHEPEEAPWTLDNSRPGCWRSAGALVLCGHAQPQFDPYTTGMTLLSRKGCPVFVGTVAAGSPAEQAGIKAGDRVVWVAGNPVEDLAGASRLLRANDGTQAVLTLRRGEQEITVESRYERQSMINGRNGQKVVSGLIVPQDTAEAEVERILAFDGRRIVARVFPTHYPAHPEQFHAGFEIFVLRGPKQVQVGGIEEGPASDAGVHYGDVLLSVNGVAVKDKTPSELEQLFSRIAPATIHLRIERLGSMKEFAIQLGRAADIAHRNGKRIVDGQVVPVWAADADLHCFLP